MPPPAKRRGLPRCPDASILDHLPTLHDRPSWVNRAGRVDRSACFALRCRDIWPLVDLTAWRRARTFPRPSSGRGRGRRDGLGDNAHGRILREARAEFTLYTALLNRLLADRLPAALQGDRRPRAARLADSLALHLPADYEAPITLERWRLHERLAQHFFLCPACTRATVPASSAAAKPAVRPGEQRETRAGVNNGPMPPFADSGRPSRGEGGLPAGRCMKLFLAMGTQAEARDAALAERYLAASTTFRSRPLPPTTRAALITRYGLLFTPRPPLCRHCLHLRYGQIRGKG